MRPNVSESDHDETVEPIKKPSRSRREEKERERMERMEGGGKDSRGRDKEKKPAGGGAMPCWQRALLALLFFCGPVGTVISFLLLPKEAEPSDALGTRHAPMGAGGGPRIPGSPK